MFRCVIKTVELGYSFTLRCFYLYSLLCRIRDIENYGSIDINGRRVKIALMVTAKDNEDMENELELLNNIKNDENKNDKAKDDGTTYDKAKDNGTMNDKAKDVEQQKRHQNQIRTIFCIFSTNIINNYLKQLSMN